MEYRIGEISENFGKYGHNFIIVKDGNLDDLVYYSCIVDSKRNPDHDEIIRKYRLSEDRVVAVGEVDHGGEKRALAIWSASIDKKGANKELMRGFEKLLLEAYQKVCLDCSGLKTVLNFCPDRDGDREELGS